MHFEPLGNQVLIEHIPEDEVKSGALVLLTGGSENVYKGRVISTGEGHLREDNSLAPMRVKVGDTVLYSELSACFVLKDPRLNDGKTHHIIRENELLGFFRGE